MALCAALAAAPQRPPRLPVAPSVWSADPGARASGDAVVRRLHSMLAGPALRHGHTSNLNSNCPLFHTSPNRFTSVTS